MYRSGQQDLPAVPFPHAGKTTLSSITLSTPTGSATLPLTMTVCQANAVTGQYLAAPAPTITLSFAPGATPTFLIFVSASGSVAHDPDVNRIYVYFKTSGRVVEGSASVAVTTLN